MDIKKIKKILKNQKRVQLGFFPTPFHKLNNISQELGVELFIKRDDMIGPCAFGGNKIRKLEYLIAEALQKKCDYTVTYGATQSNHAMQTALASKKCGLGSILFLVPLVPLSEELRSNILLDKIMGAEIHIVHPVIKSNALGALRKAQEKSKKHIDMLEQKGIKCYVIPSGGANARGTLGFVNGYVELSQQLHENGIDKLDYIVHPAGTGGTLAGLMAGKQLLESDVRIISFGVVESTIDYSKNICDLANKTLEILGEETNLVKENMLHIDFNYLGEAYEKPTDESTEAIKYVARKEGIFLDPVYTSKAFVGLCDYIKRGIIPQNSKILFWHTGGIAGLFAEKEILGKIE